MRVKLRSGLVGASILVGSYLVPSPRIAVTREPMVESVPDAPTLLARDLSWPWLVGTDERYVYWLGHEGEGDKVATNEGRLMRAPKAGGQPGTLLDVKELEPRCGFVGDDRHLSFVQGTEALSDIGGDIVTFAKQGAAAPRTAFASRHDPCNLVVRDGRLFWTEEQRHLLDVRGGPVSVFSAKTDGSDQRRLWRSPEPGRADGLFEDGASLFLAFSKGTESEGFGEALGGGGLGMIGVGSGARRTRPGESSTASEVAGGTSLIQIPKGGGAPKTLWSGRGFIEFRGTDGGDLLFCADAGGLFRLPRAQPDRATRVTDRTCPVKSWHGWRLSTSPQDLTTGGPMTALRLAAPHETVDLFEDVAGSPFPVVADADTFYACVRAPKQTLGHCDLMRAGQAFVERRLQDQIARKKAEAESLVAPYRSSTDDRASPGPWSRYEPGLVITQPQQPDRADAMPVPRASVRVGHAPLRRAVGNGQTGAGLYLAVCTAAIRARDNR